MTEELAAATFGCRIGMGLLLLNAAVPKILAIEDFANAVHNYRLLPQRLEMPVARALPLAEAIFAGALIAGVATRFVATLVAATLLVFAGAVAANLARGRRIDCGCYSSTSPRTIGWPLVAEDALLAGVAAFISFHASPVLSVDTATPSLGRGDSTAAVILAIALVEAKLLVAEALRIRRAKSRLT